METVCRIMNGWTVLVEGVDCSQPRRAILFKILKLCTIRRLYTSIRTGQARCTMKAGAPKVIEV